VIALRIFGGLLAVAGLVLAFAPTLVSDPGPAPDLFEATERHVRWGLLIGIGGFLAWRTRLKPWWITALWFVFFGSAGYLVARLIGIAMVGPSVVMQWVWVAVEVLICAVIGGVLWWKRDADASAG